MKFSAVEPLWEHLTTELASLQRQTDDGRYGHVTNSICDEPHEFDTATASEVFALEYRRTADDTWKHRVSGAVQTLQESDLYGGIDELRWGPDTWFEESGSLFLTGTVLDSLWETTSLYQPDQYIPPTSSQLDDLISFLEQCRHGDGRFAHNITDILGNPPPDVQNTTAYGLYLLERINRMMSSDHPIFDQRTAAVDHLSDGQRSDGFWPYIYPSRLQRVLYRIKPSHPLLQSPIATKLVWRGDSSIFFGDTAHHCYVQYYLTKAMLTGDCPVPRETITNGWEWIESKLVRTEAGNTAIDFSWEPEPNRIRFCNFLDTTSYFLILAILPLLINIDVIKKERADRIAEGLLAHIRAELLDADRRPVVHPHEGPQRIRRKIIPALWESSAWKGGLLARYIHTHPDLKDAVGVESPDSDALSTGS